MDNLQTNNSNKKYYIPMEVTNATIKDFGINPADVEWTGIGHRKVRVIMVPATKDQYYEYMRPLWREDRHQQRQEPVTSLDKMYEETEIGQVVGMSQRGVNKRKHKVLKKLKTRLKDYE